MENFIHKLVFRYCAARLFSVYYRQLCGLCGGLGTVREGSLAAIALCSWFLISCTTLPALDEATGGIPIYDIVLRTKCELSSAFTDDQDRWMVGDTKHYPKYNWLKNWTAQVDLTLQILDQATLAPGASLMQPLHNAYPTNVGPSTVSTSGAPGTSIAGVSQSFAVAAGVSLNGQAQRTQTMSYVYSVKELEAWRKTPNIKQLCAISDQMDLRGRLGLKEWFRQAVGPVVSGQELLYAGYHQKPTVSAQSGPSKPESVSEGVRGPLPEAVEDCDPEYLTGVQQKLNSAQDDLNDAITTGKEVQDSLKTLNANETSARATIQKAQQALKKDQEQYGPVLDPMLSQDLLSTSGSIRDATTFDQAAAASLTNALQELDELTAKRGTEATQANDAIRDAKALMGPRCKKAVLNNYVAMAIAHVKKAIDNAYAAKANVAIANDNLKKLQTALETVDQFTSKSIDPPIASFGQSVQFILVYGGNITPTWTFVRFKGPNNPLFSSSGTRTHTLNITLGPVNPGTNTPNSDVKTNQFYLQINSLLAPLIP